MTTMTKVLNEGRVNYVMNQMNFTDGNIKPRWKEYFSCKLVYHMLVKYPIALSSVCCILQV